MLTPQQVAEQTFNPVGRGKNSGYNMEEVDNFLDQITADYTALVNENADLKNKLKILADKITEYRETEDIMRSTLRGAQKTANDMVAEAEQKREGILDALEQDIRARKAAYDDEIAICRAQLAAARKETADYISSIQALTDRQQSFLDTLPDLGLDGELEGETELETPEVPAEEPAAEAAEAEPETADSIGDLIADEAAEVIEEEEEEVSASAPAPQPDPVANSATSRIDFSNLKFGKDYKIK
ncbi:MAG: DivIVA domain-containing protein [Oscillospiraceae bacterium]|nr:DivIVA domain-containing protein [Oscillospiraceae bacterium]